MELRLLDEVLPLGSRGVALLTMDARGAKLALTGATLIDARGNRHTVARVSEQDGVWTFYLPDGDADYFCRLFRDVRLDATLVCLKGETDA